MNRNEGKYLVEKKVEDFSTHREEYQSKTFHETSARSRFIDPFFQALGWNLEQTNLKPHLWDVIREYSDHSTTKRPDYAFRLNSELKFFVEAKAPHVPLTHKEPVFQAKRYAFSTNGKAPVVILTDFEEFRVFNALRKPDFNLPMEGVLKQFDLTFESYLEKWDLLYDHFSREAVADGSLEELKGKLTKNTRTLDQEFLTEITGWREMIARNMALRNRGLSVDELNVSVQRLLDRLIFIRNLEDRHIEVEGKLLSLAESKTDIYSTLIPMFRKLDQEYNGLLFKQHFSEKLFVDDKVLIHIIKHVSWPLSPYQFDVIEPEILGRIYEKFLGSKIRLTKQHHAKIEKKPEVRKAGGVYYTPQFIVDYIVKHTVGEKIKGKSPEEISEIKIVDPACGSGSFLLGAFEYLMNFHADYYITNKSKRRYKNDWYETAEGEIRLSQQKKSDILKNNIFGVDIDREATEVAVMSLYLKLLDEGFDKGQAMLFMKGHILPDMSGNIKCGNSLIGSDYYDGQNLSLFNDEETKKVNAFDWEVEFQEVFRRDNKPFESEGSRSGPVHRSPEKRDVDGFDVVIGNPPYVRSQLMDDPIKKYLSNRYDHVLYQPDTFAFFIQKGTEILCNKGRIGFIIPNGILTNTYYAKLREYLLNNTVMDIVVDLKDGVFTGASVDTSIFIFQKENNQNKIRKNSIKIGECFSKQLGKVITPSNSINQTKILLLPDYALNTIMNNVSFEIVGKVKTKSIPLDEFFEVKAGMKVRKIFINEKKIDDRYKKILFGRDLKPYITNWSGKWVCYDKNLEKAFSNQAFREENIFLEKRKLLVRQVMGKERIYANLDSMTFYTDQTIYVLNSSSIDLEYSLAIICSKLLSYYFKVTLSDRKQTFPKIKGAQIKQLPIRQIDFDNKSDKKVHDEMVTYVNTMLDLNKKLPDVKMEHEKTVIQRQIDFTDRKIDKLVYELYGLTEDEIKIVEESVK